MRDMPTWGGAKQAPKTQIILYVPPDRRSLRMARSLNVSGKYWSGPYFKQAVSRYGSSLFFYPHILILSLTGGMLMKPQELTVSCRYSEEDVNITQIIKGSFAAFVKKELQNAAKRPHFTV